MKTLRITIALLVIVLAAACSVSPTGPMLDAENSTASMEGGGFFGGGTRS
jgi:hypothetical protein